MFDLDVSKLMIFGIVAIAVIPPKDLPRVLRNIGQYVGKMRRMASEFQGQFMDALKEADLESVKREIDAVNAAAKVDVNFDPAQTIRNEITTAVEGPKPAEAPADGHVVASHVEAGADGQVSTAVHVDPPTIAEREIHEKTPAPAPHVEQTATSAHT